MAGRNPSTTSGGSGAIDPAGSSKKKKVRRKKDKVTRIANKVAREAKEAGADLKRQPVRRRGDSGFLARQTERQAWNAYYREQDRIKVREAKKDKPDVATEANPDNVPVYKPTASEAFMGWKDAKPIYPNVVALSQEIKPAAEYASAITPGGRGAKIGTSIVKAIGKSGAKSGAKTSAKAAAKGAEKAAKRTKKAEAKVAKAIEKKNTTAAQRAKDRSRKSWKKNQPAALTKTGRKVKRRQRATGIQQTAISAAPVVGGVGAGVASSTGQAFVEDPGKVLKTTARAIPGLVTAPVKLAAEVYESGKNVAEGKDNPLAPLKAELEAQGDYYKQYAKVAEGGEAAQRIIKNDLGLLPVITGGLTAHAVTRPLRSGAPKRTERRVVRDGVRPVRVKTLRKRIADPASDLAEEAAQKLMEAEAGKGRKKRRVAQRMDTAKRRIQAHNVADMDSRRPVEKLPGKRKQAVRDLFRTLAGTRVNDEVNMSDVAHLVMHEGIPLDAAKGRAALIEIRDALKPPKVDPSQRAKPDKMVLDAIIARPELLEMPELRSFWDEARAARRDLDVADFEDKVGVEKAAGRTDPNRERPRLLSIARQKGIDLPEERVHPELRDLDDDFGLPETKVYRDHDKAVRKQAKDLIRRAKRAEVQAQALRKTDPDRAAKLEAKAASLRAAAETRLAVVNREKEAVKLDAEALNHEKAGDMDAARDSRSHAIELRRQSQAGHEAKLTEFRSDVQRVIDSGERRDPVFFHAHSAALDLKTPSGGGKNRAGAGQLTGNKQNLGKLREMGLVDHNGRNLMEDLFRDRANQEMARAIRDVVNEAAHPDFPAMSGQEMRRQIETGEAPAGYRPIPVQEIKRAYEDGKLERAMQIVKGDGVGDKIDDAGLKAHPGLKKGKKYVWASSAMMDELYGQMEQVGKGAKSLRAFGAVQSLALLGTSPTWVAFQSIATPMVMLARHPNPKTWAKAGALMRKSYKELTPRERKAFEAEFGANVGSVYGFKDLELGATPDNVRSMRNARKAAARTLPGRTLHSIFTGGGPLIRGVAKYEGKLRYLEALMEMDKLHNHTGPRKFLGSLAVLDHATRQHIERLDGLPPVEKARYYANHPDEAKFLQDKVNDAIGDWSSLTRREKNASGLLIFYPFLRFSLKWTFNTFPKNNPIKAAILANLAQQNAQEVEKLLGGTPSFFSSFGLVPFRNGEGKITGGLNLSRVAPGSNALIEGIGGEEEITLSTFGRMIQPVISSAALQGIGGLDPFTGEKVAEGWDEKKVLFLKQIFGLNPITRAAVVPKIAPSSDISKLFQDRSPWEKSLVPDPVFNAAEERQKAALGRTLEKSANAPTSEEIGAVIDDLIARGIKVNPYNLSRDPAVKVLVRREKAADAGSDEIQAALRARGLGDSPEAQEAFGVLYGMLNYPAPKKKVRRKTKSSGGLDLTPASGGGLDLTPSSKGGLDLTP